MNSKLSDFLKPSQMDSILPEGTKLFVGINLVRENGEWVQKGAFAKIQNMGKSYSKKTYDKVNLESGMAKELMDSSISEDNGDW